MANTHYLKQVVEPHVVGWLSRRAGILFHPALLAVGPRADGTEAHFAFDGVSADQRAAVLVSTSLTVKSGGTRKLHVDASILLQTPLDRRVMVFISEDVRRHFANTCDGLLPLSRIEMLVCDDLPDEMRRQIALIQAEAKAEVGDRGRIRKPGGRRR